MTREVFNFLGGSFLIVVVVKVPSCRELDVCVVVCV